jgi:hypothetical protein
MAFKSLARTFVISILAALVGCGGGGSSSNNGGGSNTPSLTTLTLSPIGPAVTVGGTFAFSANGTYSDGSTKDLTSSATWSSSDASKATINAGTATGVAPGVVTITVTNSGKSASTALNVTSQSLGNSKLSGAYVFQLDGVDSNGPQFFVGMFQADGNGNINTGEADVNTAAGVQAIPLGSVKGTYTIFADGRGTAQLSLGTSNVTFRFILSSDGTHGQMIEFDGAATVRGTFQRQATAPLTTANHYVFRMRGVNAAGKEQGQIGRFIVSSGAPNGTIDLNIGGQNLNGTGGTGLPLTVSVTPPDSTGRGTASFDYSTGTPVSAHFAYYQSSTTVYFVQTDARTAGAVAGVAEQQATSPTLTPGTFVFLTEHAPNGGAPSAQFGTFEILGQLNLATSTLTGTQNEDLAPNTALAVTGTYTVDPTTGRGTLSESTSASANYRAFTLYSVSSEKFYLLEQSCMTCAGTAGRGSNGEALMQSGQSLSGPGPIAFMAGELGESNMLMVGQMTVDGSGNVTGIEDLVDSQKTPAIQSLIVKGRLPAQSPATFNPSPNVGPDHFIYYTVSSGKAYILGVLPDINGLAEAQ